MMEKGSRIMKGLDYKYRQPLEELIYKRYMAVAGEGFKRGRNKRLMGKICSIGNKNCRFKSENCRKNILFLIEVYLNIICFGCTAR